MTALEQKKLDYQTALETLKAEKASKLDAKVEAYKAQLLKEQTHEDEDKLVAVIDALDKVIEYENTTATETTSSLPNYFTRFIK